MNSINKLLTLKNISKTYHSIKGETTAIKDISFDLYNNEFVGIIGPSGCGKSSILNIISGLDNEYSGTISIKDNVSIGYMLQDACLFSWLTIYENAILGLKISKKLKIKRFDVV